MKSSKFQGLVSLKRSSTQRKVLYYLIENDNSNSDEIAKELNLSVNAVNLALHYLHKKGLIKRVSRGIYSYNLGLLLLPLLHKYLEDGKRRR
jgi:predicted transcriptional regulator